MSVAKQNGHLPDTFQKRQIKVGKWNKSLKSSDVNQIWLELHRIVSSHPLVRASKSAGFLVEEGKYKIANFFLCRTNIKAKKVIIGVIR